MLDMRTTHTVTNAQYRQSLSANDGCGCGISAPNILHQTTHPHPLTEQSNPEMHASCFRMDILQAMSLQLENTPRLVILFVVCFVPSASQLNTVKFLLQEIIM